MSLPARGSRAIVVDGRSYRWRVRSVPTAAQRAGAPLVLAFAAEVGGASVVAPLEHAHPSNRARLRARAVTPAVVAAWIRTALARGWTPGVDGPQFHLDGAPAMRGPPTEPRDARPLDRASLLALPRRDVLAVSLGVRDAVELAVNGEPLVELAERTESPWREREAAEWIAAGDAPDLFERGGPWYAPRSAGALLAPSRALLDGPDGDTMGLVLHPDDRLREKTALLGCECGFVECWPLFVRTTLSESLVVWSDFEQLHRPWTYDLGPYVFERDAYERALAAVAPAARPR